MDKEMEKRAGTVFRYHEETKHFPQRYAKSLGFMDWENQPLPFRFFEGAEKIPLGLSGEDPGLCADTLFHGHKAETSHISIEKIAGFLRFSLGLSAWKEQGSARWVLRVNPSSGNLHPTECYLVMAHPRRGALVLAHYNPFLHCLEVLGEYAGIDFSAEEAHDGFILILTSIHWREAWKYGERAYRYCSLDAGHALAALRFSANLLGWNMKLATRLTPGNIHRLFGPTFDEVDPFEMEHADGVCFVGGEPGWFRTLLDKGSLKHGGARPNRLSREHYHWKIIDDVARAVRISPHEGERCFMPGEPPPILHEEGISAQGLIMKRRSAVCFDRKRSAMGIEDFTRILARLMPDSGAPFDLFPYAPAVNPVFFVHHVRNLCSGMYVLIREPAREKELRDTFDPGFVWEAAMDGVPLMLLKKGDFRDFARKLSCMQEIASESAFVVSMLASFGSRVEKRPFIYPRLFWECGMMGQVLYLEAERAGLRGTGIGCFFDDMLHEYLGLAGRELQLLYNFTVGFPLDDPRLRTGRAYSHLGKTGVTD